MKFIVGMAAALLLLTAGLGAQDLPKTWTLNQCVEYALENNIQVQTTAMQAQSARNNLESARWSRSPDLSAGASTGWNFGLNIDPVTNEISTESRNTISGRLSSSWQLFSGGRVHHSIAQNNFQYMAGLFDLERVKNDVSLNVASAYLQIMLNQEILQVAIEQERVTQLQVNRTRQLFEAGAVPEGDLFQFEAQLARDAQNRITAQNAVLIAKLGLANLLQLERPEEFEIASPKLVVPEPAILAVGPDKVFSTARETQPDLKAAEKRIESSEAAISVSKSAYYPSLSFVAQVGTNYSDQIIEATGFEPNNAPIAFTESGEPVFLPAGDTRPTGFQDKPFSDQVGDNINEYVGFNLNVPLFNRMQVKNNVENARLNYKISQLQLEQASNQLRQTIYQAHADAKASYNMFIAAEQSVKASQASFDYARDRFEVGAINQFDFENAKNNLAVAQSEMLRSKFDYIFKVQVLQFYLTNQIKL